MTPNRLLLDQMLDAHVARALVAAGYDVVRLAEVGLARADDAVSAAPGEPRRMRPRDA